ncbi:MAG: hypothetical protein PUB20_07395 [Clostridia bacterium]|nr:hypothetical protein [Clostridia bacterium]
MKKLLAVLAALSLCATVAYTALAADDAVADEPTTVAEETVAVDDVLAELENNEQAKELADQIADALQNSTTSGDVQSLLDALVNYAEGAGVDLSQDGALRDVLDKFLNDAGVNSDELNKAIEGSPIADKILGLYAPDEEPTTPDEPTEEPTDDVVIPDTDYVG